MAAVASAAAAGPSTSSAPPPAPAPAPAPAPRPARPARPQCGICCETFNKASHVPIECNYCNKTACRECVETYVLNQNAPTCMHCGNTWNREFVDANFTKTFRDGQLKRKREDVLLSIEEALLPETQAMASAERDRADVLRRKAAKLRELAEARRRVEALRDDVSGLENQAWRLRNIATGVTQAPGATGERRQFIKRCPGEGCNGYLSTQYNCGLCHLKVCSRCLEPKGDTPEAQEAHACNPDTVASVEMLARDTRGCPKCATPIHKIDGCFAADTPVLLFGGGVKMSQDVAAGDVLVGDDGAPRTVQDTCTGEDELFRVAQGSGTDYVVNSMHCLLLLPEPHAPPSSVLGVYTAPDGVVKIPVAFYLKLDADLKQALRGYSVTPAGERAPTPVTVEPAGRGRYWGWLLDGNHRFLLPCRTSCSNCDQMYCVQCHTAFSWRTGRVETGHIHNPHYYEWQRRMNNGEAPRVPGDVPGGCAAADRDMPRPGVFPRGRLTDALSRIQRNVLHVQYTVLPQYNGDFRVGNNSDLRVKYLLGDIDKPRWKRLLQQRDKKSEKDRAIRQALEVLVHGSIDIYHHLLADRDHPCAQAEQELGALRAYTNECLSAICQRFACSFLMHLDDTWAVRK